MILHKYLYKFKPSTEIRDLETGNKFKIENFPYKDDSGWVVRICPNNQDIIGIRLVYIDYLHNNKLNIYHHFDFS